jgi:adenylosuccinate lyase
MLRHRERLLRAKETVSYGKISGAVGTYAHIHPSVEKYVCRKLGIKPAPVSNQIVQRDRHAEYLTTLAIIGCSIEKFATEIRSLQRTEILEMEEPFSKGQKGSSAMPHKRNPVLCERLCGMARLLRGNALVAMENVALWNERDISHSSAERVIIPDSNMVLHNMLETFHFVITGLKVYPRRMLHNIDRTRGLLYSQKAMLALTRKGLTREQAYKIVQSNAMKVWQRLDEDGPTLKELLLADSQVRKFFSAKEIESCFTKI